MVLSKEQAVLLFERNCVLLGSEDGVPLYLVRELCGDKAAKFACRGQNGKYGNAFGVGDYTLSYVSKNGFLAAISFHNVEQIRDSLTDKQKEPLPEQPLR